MCSAQQAHSLKFHSSLIVCASLVENPMNLGGLCRTAEVLGVASLILPDLAIAQNWAFRKLSASAHYWQTLKECAPQGLPAWIARQKQQGYQVLALTPEGSRSLTTHCFAEKTALVLGRELTGVPETILTLCNEAIAIPQFGQVNSLNVHSAAAIAIYEYIRQRLTAAPMEHLTTLSQAI